MAKQRTIEQGESLLSIAYEGGFDTWKRVWDDPANAELRERREDPQALLPGDELVVPRRKTDPTEPCSVNKIHRFRLVRPRAWVNLRMLDDAGEPIVGARFELVLEGETHCGTTDPDGFLSVEVTPTAREGTIRLWSEDRRNAFEARLAVGHIDPRSEWSGFLGRLQNLGVGALPRRDRATPGNATGFAGISTKHRFFDVLGRHHDETD